MVLSVRQMLRMGLCFWVSAAPLLALFSPFLSETGDAEVGENPKPLD